MPCRPTCFALSQTINGFGICAPSSSQVTGSCYANPVRETRSLEGSRRRRQHKLYMYPYKHLVYDFAMESMRAIVTAPSTGKSYMTPQPEYRFVRIILCLYAGIRNELFELTGTGWLPRWSATAGCCRPLAHLGSGRHIEAHAPCGGLRSRRVPAHAGTSCIVCFCPSLLPPIFGSIARFAKPEVLLTSASRGSWHTLEPN